MLDEREKRREYRTVFLLVSALANIVIDALSGLLWDREETDEIKKTDA